MDPLLKALDLVWKLIPLVKTWTGERRRNYFDQIIRPLFESFETVHELYNELFLSTGRKLTDVRVRAMPFVGSEPILTEADTLKLDNIKREFLEKRKADEWLRDALRNEAQELFGKIHWPEERRLLASIMYYFIGRGAIAPSDEDLDQDIQGVIAVGGVSRWDTPSMWLYLQIREKQRPDEIMKLLDDERNNLNQKHMNVRILYRRVQHELAMKT
jgi:hypothetical protein